jgi:Lon protease-like protein
VTAAPLTADELAVLPVFPLPRVVFFPGSRLPLHLFEPRYRALIADCLANGPHAMAIALLAPGWESHYDGRPPIHDIAGAGRIVAHERLADGTYNVLLDGVARVRLEELAPDEFPYRRARAAALEAPESELLVSRADLTALVSAASAIAAEVRRAHGAFSLGIEPGDTASRLADTIADRLVSDTARRQAILETVEVPARVRLVTATLAEILAVVGGSETARRPDLAH